MSQKTSKVAYQKTQPDSQKTQPDSQKTQPDSQKTQPDSQKTQPVYQKTSNAGSPLTMYDVENCYKKLITQIHQCHELTNSLFPIIIAEGPAPTAAQANQTEEGIASVMRSLKELLVTLQADLAKLAHMSEQVMGAEALGYVKVVTEMVSKCQETVKWFEDPPAKAVSKLE